VEADAERGAVKTFLSKRRVWVAAAVMVLALFLLRPGASKLKARITRSISQGVGRNVEIGGVQFRFLPQPGFDLDNVVIHENPGFGAEPMLRAQEVTAVIRLRSLARGRLEIARLELSEPSLNLVRRADGRWNWEDLLERTERAPLAPTAKAKSGPRPAFPYIEASSGRINFKSGAEKKPYALLNADFVLWQESENAWGARLKAEPFRTDVSTSDTGLLRMEGTWQRAASLAATPLNVSVEWNGTPLGQMTKLISGNDKGWRGEVRLHATLSGTPAAMRVTVDTSIQNFHRYDISSTEELRLAAHCDGTYSSVDDMVREILCRAPAGDGMVTLHGDAGLPGVHKVDLSLNLNNVPLSAVAALARRAKKNLPADLASAGTVQGNFAVKEDGVSSGPEFQGRGEIDNLKLQSADAKVEFATATIPFVLSSGKSDTRDRAGRKSARPLVVDMLPAPEELHVEFGPFPLALGRPAQAQARGWVARSGYGVALRGEGEISHTLRLAGLLGLPAIHTSAEGGAQMELQIAGSWAGNQSGNSSGFSLPEVTGTVHLRNVHARVRGVSTPIEISSAELRLLSDEARMEKLNARAAGAVWTGTVETPRGCGMPGACLIRFNLNAEELGLTALAETLAPPARPRAWYDILPVSAPVPSFFESAMASGKVSISRLRIHNIVAGRVSAALDLEHGKLKVSNLRADVFGGKHQGDWDADFSGESPVYTGSGTLSAISLQQVADAMHDSWISGTAAGTYHLTASGADAAAFWQSAEGGVQFDVRDAALPHILWPSDASPLRVAQWQGRAQLRHGKIEIDKGRLISPIGMYEVSGTASLGRVLDLRLMQVGEKSIKTGAAYNITGTVAEPQVTAAPETQAKLKR